MFTWIKNILTGKGYLNGYHIRKVAKEDAEEGLILDENVPSVYEQKVINNFQFELIEHESETSEDFYKILESRDEKRIVNFIDRAWKEETEILNKAQEISNEYRKIHFKILRNEKNPAITLDIEDFLTYSYKLPKGIKSLLDYKAVLQARDDAKIIENKIETSEKLSETFYQKNLKVAQIEIITNYENSRKIPHIIQEYLDDKIEKPELQNRIKELKANEQKILNHLYNSFYIYKNTLLGLLNEANTTEDSVDTDTLRQNLRLYYDIPLDLESIEEYGVIEKAQSDIHEGIEAYHISGKFSPYEYYLRDVYQEKVEAYYEAHGLQYRHMQDEDQILNDLENPADIKRNYHNPLIVQRGISFENRLETSYVKLINLYRMEYLRLFAMQEEDKELLSKLPYTLTLKYYFRNIEDETLTIEMVKNAAMTDASIFNNSIKEATPFMYAIQKKHQKLVDINNTEFERESEALSENDASLTAKSLFATYLEKESILLNQYQEFQILYIREFVNRKHLQSEEKIEVDVDDDSDETLIPMLNLYFDNLNSSVDMMNDEDIIDLATSDAISRIAQKRYPDYTFSEKKIRNEFMYYFEDQKKKTALENIDSLYETVIAKYNIKIDLYRSAYLEKSDDEEFEAKLFIFGYLPIDLEMNQDSSEYKMTQRAIIDVKNRIASCVYVQDILQKYKIVLEKNYQTFLVNVGSEVDMATGVNLDDGNSAIYKEYAGKEQDSVMDMRSSIQFYQNQFTLFEKSFNPEYVQPTKKECPTYIELYFDNEITNEKTAQQGERDLERGITKSPTPYQSMITAYYQLKMHKLKKSYLNQIKDAQRNYIANGDATGMTDLRAMQALEIEQINNKYNLMMQHYLSCNTGITDYKMPTLV